MRGLVLLALGIAFLLCANCNRCKETHYLQPISKEIMSIYQPGNWWIYANADSSVIDCVWVNYRNDNVTAHVKGGCPKRENINAGLVPSGRLLYTSYPTGMIACEASASGDFINLSDLGFTFDVNSQGKIVNINSRTEFPLTDTNYRNWGKTKGVDFGVAFYSIDYGTLQMFTPNYDTLFLVNTNLKE